MPFHEDGKLKTWRFASFLDLPVVHGIYSRHGGVSASPFVSLNVGGTVGDTLENVIENRGRIFSSAGRDVSSIFDVWQVHGNDVVCTDTPRPLSSPHQKADAILTDAANITLFMRFADCVPVFLFDPIKKVIGIVHAGWPGTVKKIAASAVHSMCVNYGSSPDTIIAGIGPSIGPDHYEIKEDVRYQVVSAFGLKATSLLNYDSGRIYLDLWKANQCVMEEAGVRKIEIAEICTACHTEDWYSHRKESGITGRFGALFALRE